MAVSDLDGAQRARAAALQVPFISHGCCTRKGLSTGMSVRCKTILLVDDEASQRERMRRALREAGFRVVAVADYGAAVASFQQHSGVIDMLVTDLALPGKNGCELAMSLWAIQPKLRVLFTSAHAGAELRRFSGMTAPDEHFLEKPFQSSELVRRVRYLLERVELIGESAGM